MPAGLDYLKHAEHRIRAHSAQVGRLLQDRSELLQSVRLLAEARESAEQAIEEYAKEQREIKLPEVRLLLARAALLDGDVATAIRHSGRAVREFIRQRRSEWAALARLAMLQAQRAASQPCRMSSRNLERIVATLAASGWPTATMEARSRTASTTGRTACTADSTSSAARGSIPRRSPPTDRSRGSIRVSTPVSRAAGARRLREGGQLDHDLADRHRQRVAPSDRRTTSTTTAFPVVSN